MDEGRLRVYFERLNPLKATTFFYKYIETGKTNQNIADVLAKSESTVERYNTEFNLAVIEFGYTGIDDNVKNVFNSISGGPPPPDGMYPHWPPKGYVREPQPQASGFLQRLIENPRLLLILGVIGSIILLAGLVWLAGRIPRRIIPPVIGEVFGVETRTPEPTDTPIPTQTPVPTETTIPTETIPPTATEDISPQIAAIQTGTAQALPTIDRISPALTATSARLTEIAPTETPTFTPTPTDTPTPTETPSPTPTADTSALDPSKEYSNEFASLTLDSWDFNSQIGPAGWRWNMAITFVFTYKNLSGQNILLRFAESDFTMKDDLGRTFECFDDDTWTGGFSHSLGLADQVSFKIGCARGHTIGPDVSSLILNIEDFSSMGDLGWVVEILG